MTMLRLTRERRRMLQDKFPDLANLAVATAVFGQLVSGQQFSRPVAFGGIGLWAIVMLAAYLLGGTES